MRSCRLALPTPHSDYWRSCRYVHPGYGSRLVAVCALTRACASPQCVSEFQASKCFQLVAAVFSAACSLRACFVHATRPRPGLHRSGTHCEVVQLVSIASFYENRIRAMVGDKRLYSVLSRNMSCICRSMVLRDIRLLVDLEMGRRSRFIADIVAPSEQSMPLASRDEETLSPRQQRGIG